MVFPSGSVDGVSMEAVNWSSVIAGFGEMETQIEVLGGRFLRPGPAYGGSCFPKDTKGLVSAAEKYKINLSVVKSVIKSNKERVNLLTQRIHKILGSNIKNKRISFLGVTFKPNTDDMRDSTSLSMIPYLCKKGAKVNYYDPSGEKNEFMKT